MKIVRGFALGLAALAMVFLMTPSGAYANAATQPTVGDFLTAYARALNIELPASTGADALVPSLRASGVKLDANIDLAKTLTQGDVVRIGKANGLRLTTRNPEAPFTAAEIAQFFTAYGPSLAQPAGSTGSDSRFAADGSGSLPPGDPANHANTDKGKKKGRPFHSPTEPQ